MVKIMVLDQQSAEILYNKLRLVVTYEGTYKIAFENERGTNKDILSPGNRWLEPNAYLRIFGKKFMRILVSMCIDLGLAQKVRFPKRK